MDSVIQANAYNMGLSLKELILIMYLRSNFMLCEEFKSQDIFKDNILVFRDTTEVKSVMEHIDEIGIIKIKSWNLGKFTIEPNIEKLNSLFQIGEITIEKNKSKPKESIIEEKVRLLAEEYNKINNLPKCSSLTPRRVEAINYALDRYSSDEILEALKYASEQQWTYKHIGTPWYDIAWLMRNIEGFMRGGKYRFKEKKDKPVIESKVNIII